MVLEVSIGFMVIIVTFLDFFFLDSKIKAFSRWSLLSRNNFLYRVHIFPPTDYSIHKEAPTTLHFSELSACPFLNHRHSFTGFEIVIIIIFFTFQKLYLKEGEEKCMERDVSFSPLPWNSDFCFKISHHFSLFTGSRVLNLFKVPVPPLSLIYHFPSGCYWFWECKLCCWQWN